MYETIKYYAKKSVTLLINFNDLVACDVNKLFFNNQTNYLRKKSNITERHEYHKLKLHSAKNFQINI